MKINRYLLMVSLIVLCLPMARAQQADTTDILFIDDITITAKPFVLNRETNTATAKLTLLSEKAVPREFKLNVFGTQVFGDDRQAYFFQTASLGRVMVRFEDKQNYLHYLLQPDTPVELTIVAGVIKAGTESVPLVKLVFEDSQEEGRFIEAFVVSGKDATIEK